MCSGGVVMRAVVRGLMLRLACGSFAGRRSCSTRCPAPLLLEGLEGFVARDLRAEFWGGVQGVKICCTFADASSRMGLRAPKDNSSAPEAALKAA